MNFKDLKDSLINDWSTCKLAFAAGIVVGLLIGWITA